MPSPPSVASVAHVLHMCRLERNQSCALYAHSCLCNWGLDASPWLGNNIVSVLAEAGSAGIAWNVFLQLTCQTICSWNSLMIGFTKLGDSNHTLQLYKGMQDRHLHPNEHTFVAALKACTELNDTNKGYIIHADMLMNSILENSLYISSMLIHMYTTFGLLANAERMFDKLPSKNTVIWNALIAGYVKHELANEALQCFDRMQHARISPNVITFVCVLKSYGCINAVEQGREMHAEIARNNLLAGNTVIQCTLVDMYAKCGSLVAAQEVFDKLITRCLVTWTALISGYVMYEYGSKALNYFEQMRLEGVSPNSVSFITALKACSIIGALDKGTEIHTEVLQNGLLSSDRVIGNALIDMYIECGSLARAEEVFDELPFRDVVSWNTLMAGYAKFEQYEDALDLLDKMVEENHRPDAVTYIFALKSCGITGAKDKAVEIHSEVERQGLLEREIEVGNTVLDVYAKCGSLEAAREVFGRMRIRDVVSWTALIYGCADKGLGNDALKCFGQMQLENVHPNEITIVCALKACGCTKDKHKGKSIHVQMIGNEMMERDPLVCSALIGMYADCGSILHAREVFDKIPVPSEDLWNAMLAGYANHDHCDEALQFFNLMGFHGLSPDKITYLTCLKACGRVGATGLGKGLHTEVATSGLLETEHAISNAIIHMYAECGLLLEAQATLSKFRVKGTDAWTALITGYIKHEDGRSALKCFEQMQMEGVSPNIITYTLGLKACASVGAADKGQEIFSEVARQGLLERDYKLSTSLIDMYAKCGHLTKAQEVFVDTDTSLSVASWNALISPYGRLDEVRKVLASFKEMQVKGLSPDSITFLNILGVCSKAGLVESGCSYFRCMSKDHDIHPTREHQTCLLDLLSRTGNLDMANELLRRVYCRNPVMCRSMLSATLKLGLSDLAKAIFEGAAGFDKKRPVIYDTLSANINRTEHVDLFKMLS